MKAIIDTYLPFALKELVAKIGGEYFLSTSKQMYVITVDEDLLDDLSEGETLNFKTEVETSVHDLSYSVSSSVARDKSGRKIVETIDITDIEITINDDLFEADTGRNKQECGNEKVLFDLYEWENALLIENLVCREIADARLAA